MVKYVVVRGSKREERRSLAGAEIFNAGEFLLRDFFDSEIEYRIQEEIHPLLKWVLMCCYGVLSAVHVSQQVR